MTFYNIIFGILFLGAVREIFVSLALPPGQRWLAGCHAVILTLLIFSDVVYTSHAIEELRKGYGVGMKLLDLLNFIILTLALLTLNPTQNNMLQLSVESVYRDNTWIPAPHALFWFLITLYWIGLTLWVKEGKILPESSQFNVPSASSTPTNPWLISSAGRARATWFLVKRGRLLGFIILAFIALIAFLRPGWLFWLSPAACLLAIVYLVINGLILDLYKSISTTP